MNVKSFVNGLDPENTVKGYYDENDQLVMVEPEGSGGDIETAKVLITNRSGVNVQLSDIKDGIISAIVTSELVNNPYIVPLGPSGNVIYIAQSNTVEITLDGDVAAHKTIPIPGYYIVTGDCTITIESK